MRSYRTTGLILTQMQELVRRVKEALRGSPYLTGVSQAAGSARSGVTVAGSDCMLRRPGSVP